MSSHTLHLIDGHSQVFRAYHAIPATLSSSTLGVQTNAIFGFLMGLNALIREERPTHLIVTFDAGHDGRTALFPGYKANRDEMPEDLAEQMPWIERVLDALGIPVVRREGEEADDLIATLTRQARERGFDVAIISNDKDLFQLVDDHVTVLRTQPRGGTARCDVAAVREKMGVEPSQITDLLGLMGDAVDCIPGVPGVGPKTAAKLLNEHGDLESVLAAAESVKQPKLRERLIAHADDARLSRRLAALDFATDVVFDPDQCAWSLTPSQGLTELLRQLEMRALLEEWGDGGTPAEGTPGAETPGTEWEILSDEPALRAWVERMAGAPMLALDTETTDLDVMRADLVGISLCAEEGRAVYIPVGHTSLGVPIEGQLPLERVRELLGPPLADPSVPKCGHHLKFDLKVLRRAGFEVGGIAFDTLVASHMLNPDSRGHGLKELSLERLGVRQTPIEDLIGSGKSQISMAEVAIERVAPYAAQDADMTLRLWRQLRAELEKAGLLDLFETLEVPLIEVLAQMELDGVAIDPKHFGALRGELTERLAAITDEIHAIAGHEFNISSTPQLRTVLFEELGLPVQRKGKTGPSTDVGVLETLATMHPLPEKILEHRSLEKLLTTYVEALPGLVSPETGRIHTTYHLGVAATGRLSSSDPNLQNIPVRSEMGRRIRRGFVPRAEGNVFLAADYSQIELRIAAHLSGDEAMLRAFREGGDFHRATAARVHGIGMDDVTPDQREAAKRVTFGILYGISAHRLSNELRISRDEAKGLIEQTFESFSGLRAWMDRTLEEARASGFVTTLLGRRRFVRDLGSKNFNLRSAAERVAINTPVQGSAADLIKRAMLLLATRLRDEGLPAKMVLQVHDELIFDLPEGEVDTLRPVVVETMAGALPLAVPVVVDVKVGATWADC
ncbi:DNA polymerase I [Candidatus Sumerlaeota bacterium]|nr:DNA polymerase I [Candidatus Sumerlaeota bacterium]